MVSQPLEDDEPTRKRLRLLEEASRRGFRWYSRHKLWEYAEQRLDLQNASDMTDEQYMEALKYSDAFFSGSTRLCVAATSLSKVLGHRRLQTEARSEKTTWATSASFISFTEAFSTSSFRSSHLAQLRTR